MSKLTTAEKNAIKNAVAKQTDSKAEKKSVVDVMREHIKALADVDAYTFISDIDAKSDNADANAKDDYMHVYRHDTTATAHAQNNVFQCYYKHTKQQVYVLANRVNFTAFETSVEHKDVKTSLIRYYVSYEQFTAFMHSICEYDNSRRKATATATEQTATDSKAK